MLKTAQAFMKACEAKDWHYKDARDLENGKSVVVCGISGQDTRYDIRFFFDQDETSVAVRVFGLTRVQKDAYARVLLCANSLNLKFRWVKFCIDKDDDLNLEHDAVVNTDNAGEVCVEILGRFMGIVDKAYPVIMKAQYGE